MKAFHEQFEEIGLATRFFAIYFDHLKCVRTATYQQLR